MENLDDLEELMKIISSGPYDLGESEFSEADPTPPSIKKERLEKAKKSKSTVLKDTVKIVDHIFKSGRVSYNNSEIVALGVQHSNLSNVLDVLAGLKVIECDPNDSSLFRVCVDIKQFL